MLSLVAGSASGATPATTLTITTWSEGDRSMLTYKLTCSPASVRPRGLLRPLNACAAIALVGDRLYRPRLSVDVPGCSYIQSPRRASIVGTRLGKRVRTAVEIGACERLLVARATLERFLVWPGGDTS